MKQSTQFFFAARLAWRQLTHDRAKLIAAMLGVLFACVLVFMQLGFKDSLMDSATSVPRKMQGDLFLMHKQTEALWRTVSFSRRELMRTYGHQAVLDAKPLYLGQTPWKNPKTQTKRTLMVFGYDPDARLFTIPELDQYRHGLTVRDTVIFDELSRPEFGPVTALLQKGTVYTEVNDHRVEVIGVFKMGASFAADGNMMTSDQNFLRIFPNRSIEQIDLGVIRLKPSSDIVATQRDLKALMTEDVYVLTYAELVAYERAYWENNAPVGFIFGFGVIMGLVVGMVIVYQILFTDITNHLNEYATLKAMGYSNRYLVYVVFSASLILAVMGFIPGWLLSISLYALAESVTFIPMPMPLSKISFVFCLILGMCIIAGSLAMHKLKAANPADMF